MISESAQLLDQARLEAREVERLTVRHPELDVETAYRISDEGIRMRLARGERVIGLKMGLTSEAKRKQMNLDSPCYGTLTDRMQIPDGGMFKLPGSIHPKIEPEVAFIIGRELSGKIDAAEALAACTGVCAAMEILDSRFVGFKYFSLPDVIADNSSSSMFVLGSVVHAPESIGLDRLAQLAMEMHVNGAPAQAASSGAISGNPVASIVQLCELLAKRGQTLPANSIVLAGAATPAVNLEPGMRVELRVEALGTVSVSVS